MGQDYKVDGPDHGRLNLTPWTVVLKAVQSQAPGAPQALAELCERYWRPLYTFARRRGRSPEDAENSVQGFFAHLIGSHGLATVERSKGRFRNFLVGSFKNFMMAEDRHDNAQKRRPPIQQEDEPEDPITPETLYTAQCALELLRRATERMRQEQSAKGKGEIFRTLKGFLGGDSGGCVPMTCQEAALALGISEQNVTNLIHRLRQRHGQLVREEVKRTVLDPTEVEAELHELCEALVQAEGRVRT